VALESMLRNDLFPVSNLLSVAGVWDGFDEDWLLTQLEHRWSQPPPGLVGVAVDWAVWQSVGWMIWKNWTEIKRGLRARL